MIKIKRMADRFAHMGAAAKHDKHPATAAAAAAAPPSPAPSSAVSQPSTSAVSLRLDARGSVSTVATSFSGPSKRGDSLALELEAPVEEDVAVGDADVAARLEATRRLVRRPRGRYRLSDFIIERTLGTGSFGRVHLVRSKHNLRYYAAKVLNKEKVVKMKQVEHTNNEMRMLEAVQHPFVINLWGTFQDSASLYMIMDFVPGAKFYAAEVALALNYLHSLDIIYRDLKPENILINYDGHIKVADFGFAKICLNTTWTLCGTPDYLAPEIVGQQRYNKSVDWYALGVLIFEMLSGLPPFHQHDANPVLLYEKITRGPTYIRWPAFNPHATDLILKLMEGDPTRRYGNLRNGAGDVFAHPWFREVDWERLLSRDITAPYLPKINGEGDASAFDKYPEDPATGAYGRLAYDPYGHEFPDFEYTHAS